MLLTTPGKNSQKNSSNINGFAIFAFEKLKSIT
jgi:hypothetical protein